jgi:hypothetical protein
MKKLNLVLLALALFALSSCTVITGIFKAGVAVGVIVVVAVIAVFIWIISLFTKR